MLSTCLLSARSQAEYAVPSKTSKNAAELKFVFLCSEQTGIKWADNKQNCCNEETRTKAKGDLLLITNAEQKFVIQGAR